MKRTRSVAVASARKRGAQWTGLSLCILAFAAGIAQAQVGGPGWIMAQAEPVSPAEANRIVATSAPALHKALKASQWKAGKSEGASAATEQTPEIVELARG